MAGETLMELELELRETLKKYYENLTTYVKEIKDVVKKYDPSAKALIFGSVVKGYARPDSDVDVLVITEIARNISSRLMLRVEIARRVGVYTPFEIHIVTWEEYRSWYEKFIDKYVEV